jgi:hypothetical protein
MWCFDEYESYSNEYVDRVAPIGHVENGWVFQSFPTTPPEDESERDELDEDYDDLEDE